MQRGHRNNDKTMDERQRVNSLLLPHQPGMTKATETHKWEHRHCKAWPMVEDQQTCWFFLYFRDSHKYNLPLCFYLAHRRARFSSTFDRVPLSLPQAYVSQTQMFSSSKTQGQTTISMIYVFFNSQTTSHLSMSPPPQSSISRST